MAVAGATDVDDARVVSRSECVCAERLASKLESKNLEQNFTHHNHINPLRTGTARSVLRPHSSVLRTLSQKTHLQHASC